MRDALKAAPDLARALARIVVGRGGPRDLAGIRDGLAAARRSVGNGSRRRPLAAADIADLQAALRAPESRRSPTSWRARSPTSCRS